VLVGRPVHANQLSLFQADNDAIDSANAL
jgi:hypothetical protein